MALASITANTLSTFVRRAGGPAALAVLLSIGAAAAQESIQLAQGQNSRQIPGAMVGGGSSAMGDMAMRVDRAEASMRALNGQVEELTYQIRQLQEQIRRLQEDNEFRFQELEGARGKKRSDLSPALAPAPAAPSGAPADGGQGFADVATIPSVDFGPVADEAPPAAAADAGVPGSGLPGSSAAVGAPPQALGSLPAGSLDLNSGPLDLTAMTSGGGFATATPGAGALPGVAASEPTTATDLPSTAPAGAQIASLPSGPNPREIYDTAYNHVLRGEYDQAEAGFRRFLDAYPEDRLAPDAEYWLGESLYGRADYRGAAQAFLKGYSEHPDSRKAPDSLFKLGLSLAGLGERSAACASFAELIQRYPEASTPLRDRVKAEQKTAKC